ncbi:hypothetical protein [Pontibacter rugosus]|uniref:Uncharacterized protein n=1 Tax=Pontibacter rugosus TaxID=1745966 RepID=A0ABW3SJK8_9BACT
MWQRYLFGLSMLVIYLMTTFRYLAPVVYYQLDYTYISEVLCINQDKPQLQCHGKCHLRKQLEQTYSLDKQKETLQHLISSYHAVEDVPLSVLILLSPFAPAAPAPPVFYEPGAYFAALDAPFHPPQV